MKYLIVLFVVLGFGSCANPENKEEVETTTTVENVVQLNEQQLKSFELTTTTLTERVMEQTIVLNGTLEVPPKGIVSISSVYGGRIKSMNLIPGAKVKKGQLLVELEDNQFIQLQQDYLTAEAQLQNAKAEYLRQRDLNESKASSDKVYLQAKTDYETVQINQRSLAEKLRLANIDPAQLTMHTLKRSIPIYAPFDGYVSEVFVNMGKYVDPSQTILQLVNISDMQLDLKMFEQDWGKIRVGQTLEAFTTSNPEVKYKGQITLIGKTIAEDRSIDVRATLNNIGDQLIPGMFMRAAITVPNAKAWVLPEDGVVDFEGHKYVFEKVNATTFKMLPVTSTTVGNGWVAIENGDTLHDKTIVQNGAYTLLMALKNTGEE